MRKLLFALLLLLAPAAFAGTGKPQEIASVIHADAPYGEGTYTWMLIKAYDATLWTDAKPWSMQSPFALTLHYRMHFTAKELADRSVEEMQHIAPLPEADAFGAQLAKLFHNVNSGDTITALYTPGKGAAIYYNGASTGSIADDAMAQRFMGIWLSEKTSAPKLREHLLSGSGSAH